jgi:hypothetical protein
MFRRSVSYCAAVLLSPPLAPCLLLSSACLLLCSSSPLLSSPSPLILSSAPTTSRSNVSCDTSVFVLLYQESKYLFTSKAGKWRPALANRGAKSLRLPAPPHPTPYVNTRQHTSAYVSTRQRNSAYVSVRQYTSAYVSIRQHTSAYVSIRYGYMNATHKKGSEISSLARSL